jgi:hypothetical protein
MKQFLNVILDHLIITTVLTSIFYIFGIVLSAPMNFFEWGLDSRITILLFTNLGSIFIQIGIKEEKKKYI